MSAQDTPPRNGDDGLGREKTPEVPRRRDRESDVREKDDKERSRRHRDDDDDDERRRRHRHREEEPDEERDERRKRRREDETEEEREERRRKRKEREQRDRGRDRSEDEGERRRHRSPDDRERGHRSRDADRPRRRERSLSRESHRSQRSHRSHRSSARDIDMDRERLRERENERRIEEDRRRRAERERVPRYDDRRDDRYDGRRRTDVYQPRDIVASPMRRASPPREARGSPAYGRRASEVPPPRRDEAEALLQDVDSETRSIFVSQLAAALTARDVGMFFQEKLGKGSVRDARVVTDRMTRRSKGVAYVELASVDLVHKALTLSGTIVMGLPIMIALSESEKNIHNTLLPTMPGAPSIGPGSLPPTMPILAGLPTPTTILGQEGNANATIPYHRLYVGNLFYNLTADDIRQVFEPFGELSFVEMPMEPHTNRSRGYAFVQFKDLAPAEMALASMNGFELAGRSIKVSTVHERGTGVLPQAEILEDVTSTAQGTRMDAAARQQLMYKLARQPDPTVSTLSQQQHQPSSVMRPNIPVQQTQYVQLSNMFDPSTETEPNWHLDLEEDIKEEVQAKNGKVEKLKVDKNSPEGHVFIKFADTAGAAKGIAGLNGRFFSGKRITAHYISEAIFKAHAP